MNLNFILLIVVSQFSVASYAWGPRGHDTIAIVATKVLEKSCGKKCAHPFLARDQMLGYLANVPDSYWRGLSHPKLELLNASHFIGLEWFNLPKDRASKIAFTLPEASNLHKQACQKSQLKKPHCEQVHLTREQLFVKAGTAPFRIAQIAAQLEKHLSARKLSIADIDKSLLKAGILAHYVADLSNPLHTTVDYDGWSSKAGGLHVYFESEVVDAFDLSLVQKVLGETKKHVALAEKLSYRQTAFALAKDSYLDLQTMLDLDRKHLILTSSKQNLQGLKLKAKRVSAEKAVPIFGPLILKRMAIAAVYLAHIWEKAWIKAGKPDLTGYQSYTYFHAPAPIEFEFPAHGG